jgi:hypothetical protein
LRWLGVVLLVLVGCRAAEVDLKPKYQTVDYVAPPSDDPRYYSPTSYPKDTLFQDVIKKDANPNVNPFEKAERKAAMNGAGRMPGGF